MFPAFVGCSADPQLFEPSGLPYEIIATSLPRLRGRDVVLMMPLFVPAAHLVHLAVSDAVHKRRRAESDEYPDHKPDEMYDPCVFHVIPPAPRRGGSPWHACDLYSAYTSGNT